MGQKMEEMMDEGSSRLVGIRKEPRGPSPYQSRGVVLAEFWASSSPVVAMEYPVKLHSVGPAKGLPVYEDHFGKLAEGIRSTFKAEVIFWNAQGHVMISSVYKQHFTLQTELPLGTNKVAIYNASLSRDHRGTIFTTDSRSEVLVLPTPTDRDIYGLVETCAGIGALGRGAHAMGWFTRAANDKQASMCNLMQSLVEHPVIQGDIAYPSTVKAIFEASGRVSLWAFGFSCQSFSKAGDRKGGNDDRAMSLPFGLHASFMTDAPITVLECVAEAPGDVFVRRALQHHCDMTSQCKSEVVLELAHIWPSNRLRWWCVLSHNEIGKVPLSPLPQLPRAPVVSDLFDDFAEPMPQILSQLALTQDEHQQLVAIGVDISQNEIRKHAPMPTAMHSWANQFGPCACECRNHGLSHDRLIKKGFFGVVIPFRHNGGVGYRHISAQELAVLCGFPIRLGTHHAARLEVAAVGQLASPLQSVWVFTAIRNHIAHRTLGIHGQVLPNEGLIAVCQELFSLRRTMHPNPQPGLAFDLFEAMVFQLLKGSSGAIHEGSKHPALDDESLQNGNQAIRANDTEVVEIEPTVKENDEHASSSVVDVHSEVKRKKPDTAVSFVDQLQAAVTSTKKTRIEAAENQKEASGIPGAVVGFATKDPAASNVVSEIPVIEQPITKQQVKFFTEIGFGVTPQDLIKQRIVVVNEVESTISAVGARVGSQVKDLILAEFGKDSTIQAWSMLGHPIAQHDIVDNWQCIILSKVVPDVDELSCESAQVRLYQMPRYKSMLHQGARVAVDEMVFYLNSIAVKYGVHAAVPFILSTCEDVALLVDAWLDMSSDNGKHEKFVSAMLLGGHWTPVVVVAEHGKFQLHTDPVGAEAWKAFNVPAVQVHVGGSCESNFTHDCGFQTVAWLSNFLDSNAIRVMSSDAAASWRFLCWQKTLMTPSTAKTATFVLLGGHSQEIQVALAAILREHGVFSDRAMKRANEVLECLGSSAVEQAIHSVRPWVTLKQHANRQTPKLQLVQEDEFQKIVAARARNPKPVGNKRNVSRGGDAKEVVVQPDDLVIPTGVFKQDDGAVVHQIQLRQIGSIGKGLIVCSENDIRPYLEDGVMSKEGLAFAVVEPSPDLVSQGFEIIRFPATCTTTGEPILVSAALIQKGQQQVMRVKPDRMTKIDEIEVTTVKMLVYRDQLSVAWDQFSNAPVKQLLQQIKVLTVCKQPQCNCPAWHLSDAGTVGDDPVLDVWSRDFLNENFKKVKAGDASIFTCQMRIIKAVMPAVLQMSGMSGIYVEPRTDDGRTQSSVYHTVWLPKGDHSSAVAAVAKAKHPSSLIRVNKRYGIKTLASHAAAVHAQFRDTPFLESENREMYVIGPLPWGTTRSALGSLFQEWGWQAKPIQPAGRSADGKGLLWTAQAVQVPSTTVVSMEHGDVLILRKSQEEVRANIIPKVEASTYTLQQLQKVNPGRDIGDPWAEAAKLLPSARSSDSTVAAQYFAKIDASLDKKLNERLGEDAVMTPNIEPRVKALEDQIKQIQSSQQAMNQQTQTIAHQVQQVQVQVETQSVQFQSHLDKKLEDQMSKIEALLSKRSRHE